MRRSNMLIQCNKVPFVDQFAKIFVVMVMTINIREKYRIYR